MIIEVVIIIDGIDGIDVDVIDAICDIWDSFVEILATKRSVLWLTLNRTA